LELLNLTRLYCNHRPLDSVNEPPRVGHESLLSADGRLESAAGEVVNDVVVATAGVDLAVEQDFHPLDAHVIQAGGADQQVLAEDRRPGGEQEESEAENAQRDGEGGRVDEGDQRPGGWAPC